jgi:hypothetical protein
MVKTFIFALALYFLPFKGIFNKDNVPTVQRNRVEF